MEWRVADDVTHSVRGKVGLPHKFIPGIRVDGDRVRLQRVSLGDHRAEEVIYLGGHEANDAFDDLRRGRRRKVVSI